MNIVPGQQDLPDLFVASHVVTCEMHVVRDAESEGTLSTMGMS